MSFYKNNLLLNYWFIQKNFIRLFLNGIFQIKTELYE